MFYNLKIKFMEKILKLRQKKNPFDEEKAESFKLNENDSPKVNNSYYFSAHSFENETSLFVRLGQRTSGDEVWFYYKDNENRLVLDNLIFKENNPLKVERINGIWTINFNGEVLDSNNNKINVLFNGEFVSNEKIVDFFSDMPRIRLAKAMAFEKWSKSFFDEVQENNQVHYEQVGRLKGKLVIDNKEINVDLPCVRDHSFGAREWNYMNNHLWMMAINENKQLNFSMVSYPAMSLLECGNFLTMNKDNKFILEAHYDRSLLIKDNLDEYFDVTLLLDSKEELVVKAKIIDFVDYYFGDGDYKFVEAIAEYEINGERFRGIFEVGYNKDKSRFYNGKEIKDFRV